MDMLGTFIGLVLGMVVYQTVLHKWVLKQAKEQLLAAIVKEDLVLIIEHHAKIRRIFDAD